MSRPITSRPIAMISSTFRDLEDYRQQIRDACDRAGFEPREMMEHSNAKTIDAVQSSLQMVDNATVYIGVFAHRYGDVPEGSTTSITEMEYERAVAANKPRLIFFIDENHPVPPKMVETGDGAEKLKALKAKIQQDVVTGTFALPNDLYGCVRGALEDLKDQLKGDQPKDPRETARRLHRRTPVPTPPTPYIAHPYTLSQTRELVGRREELKALTDWVTKPGSPAFDAAIFCFVAIGGMGKSALTWKWFNDISSQEMPDLAGRLWWSFYESDAYFENFLNRALCYVGELDEAEVREMPWQDREALLLQLLNDKSHLLVLDGLERILLAYDRLDASSLADDEYDKQCANVVAGAAGLPASATQSFTGQHRLRQTSDPRAGRFLRQLAQVQNSRILISTRLYPLAIQLPTRHPLPGCFPYFLMGLGDDDAVALWRQLGVSGSGQELVALFNSFENHPLLVQALAGEIARDKKTPGDFTAWRKNNPTFDQASLPAIQVKSHILLHALAGVKDGLREALTSIVALRTPATYDTLEALLVGDDKAFRQRQALDQALSELEDRGLIGWDREANRYDAHPIVRGVVWQLAGDEARDAVHAAIDAHFEPMAVPEWLQVESLADLTPAIERYHTLVERGRLDDAQVLFHDRLDAATLYRLAAHRERIAMLERLFPDGTDKLPALESESAQAWALNALAASYRLSGRPGQAVALGKQERTIDERLGKKSDLQIGLENRAHAQREAGDLRDAEGAFLRALALGRELEHSPSEGLNLQDLGYIVATVGDHEQARLALARGRKNLKKNGIPQGEGVGSAYLAELSLWQSELGAAERLADHAWRLAAVERSERDFIRAAFFQGRASLERGDLEQAEERLLHALAQTRAVNIVDLELRALIAIAELELARGKPRAARERLDEIWEPAEEGPYPLYQADACNVLVEICRTEGDDAGAIEAATKAYRAAWCDGPPWAYHWGLEKAKAHLQTLGASEPDMPPFDESKYEPMPEVEINPKDEYWVDPNAPLEALLNLDDGK